MFRLRRAGTRRDASGRLPHDKAKPPAAPGRAGNYRRNAKSRPSNRSPAPLNPAAARRRATFLAPGEAEHRADALAHLLDGGLGVLGTLFEQPLLAVLRVLHELAGEAAILDAREDDLHRGLRLGGDHLGAGGVVAVLGGVGDGVAHLGHAALVHEVHDELHLVEALEVGHLGRVARLHERLEAGVDERRHAAAEHRLLAEEVGVRLVLERGLDDAGAGAAGEALSCFMAGTKCEQAFLRQTEKEGFPETMCSYHRVFLGAALNGIVPKPKCMVYTNLACDGNMMTFPYLKERYEIPSFYIDVPYEKNYDSVMYVAKQLRELKSFLQDVTGREITEESVKKAVDKSKIASNNYYRQLHLRKGHDIASTLTNELYALFMCHLLAGTDESVRYTQLLRDDVRRAPAGDGFHVLWMHTMPFLQDAVKDVFNYSDTIHISVSDFIADGFRSMESDDPYEALAEKMVYCIYNGSVNQRIDEAKELADTVGADGAVLFAHWGCKNTIGASSLIKRSLEREGLPTMVLDGDGCNPANASDGQISTRLQAFVEMLTEQERN